MKEMEKMKNKREEKRAQNSEMRIKRAQVRFLGQGFWTGILNLNATQIGLGPSETEAPILISRKINWCLIRISPIFF